jgi:hypothetical protein
MGVDLAEQAVSPVGGTATRVGDLLVEGGITDEELTALALAADPDQPLDPGARPDPAIGDHGPLPLSYMPPAMSGPRERNRVMTFVALLLVTAFVVITALGFCMTYGALSFA